MSKSIIYTVNSTSTTVEATNIIPLGSTIRRFGGNVSQDGNSITITGKGYYHISVSATVTPEAVGNVGITTLKDGVPVTGGSAVGSVSTVGNSTTLPINAIVRNTCDCDSSVISFVLNTTTSNVDNFAVSVVKL
jgi:hypothetical protein